MDVSEEDISMHFDDDGMDEDEFNTENDQPNDMDEKYLHILRQNFGHNGFRPMQWDIIKTALVDKRDQCIVMATGYGKSLCFQYPSVFTGGTTIVISPLISLMEDQVLSLKIAGIEACFLGSAQTKSMAIIDEIKENKYRLVYLTPEYCTGDYGLQLLKELYSKLEITLLAIDEAHCVSKWGHDFRPSYQSLGKLRQVLPNVPILAVTATATDKVQQDICRALKMRNPEVRRSSFDRGNLYFEVHPKGQNNVYANLNKFIKDGTDGSTIIYAITKKETENVCDLLRFNGIACEPYHAGIPLTKRKATHEKFTRDELKVIVATIAFGMGIDKPDVRLIIHYGASKDLESYYQEVGRAGRDGLPSKCVTFFSPADFVTHNLLRQHSLKSGKQNLQDLSQSMKNYLYSTECRRRYILSYFTGEDKNALTLAPTERCCDNCTKKQNQPSLTTKYKDLDEKGRFDFTEDCRLLLEAIHALKGRYGLNLYIKFLQGSKIQKVQDYMRKLPLFGAGANRHENWWKAIGRLLEDNKFLSKTQYLAAYTFDVSQKGDDYLRDLKASKSLNLMKIPPPMDILPYLTTKSCLDDDDEPIRFKDQPKPSTSVIGTSNLQESGRVQPTTKLFSGVITLYQDSDPPDVKQFKQTLFSNLKAFRNGLASAYDCMPYMVATDTALMEMIHKQPTTIQEFIDAKFNNFNEAKINKFGSKFVEYIQEQVNKIEASKEPQTIQEILKIHPYGKASLNNSALITYNMWKVGATVQKICAERKLAASTISGHLTTALQVGCPITLEQLSVKTIEIEEIIKEIVKCNTKEKVSDIKLTELKESLPDIEWDVLRYVHLYLGIRQHVESVTKRYKDYEPHYYKMYKNLKKRKDSPTISSENEEDIPVNQIVEDGDRVAEPVQGGNTAPIPNSKEAIENEINVALKYLENMSDSEFLESDGDESDILRESPPRILGTKRQQSDDFSPHKLSRLC